MSEALSVQAVLDIIKACKTSGVRTLQLGELRIRFGESEEKVAQRRIRTNAKLEAQRIPEMEAKIRQEELEELRLRDPYEYEQLVQSEELTNDRQANP